MSDLTEKRKITSKAHIWAAYVGFFAENDGGCENPDQYDPRLLEEIQKVQALRLAFRMACKEAGLSEEESNELLQICQETVRRPR